MIRKPWTFENIFKSLKFQGNLNAPLLLEFWMAPNILEDYECYAATHVVNKRTEITWLLLASFGIYLARIFWSFKRCICFLVLTQSTGNIHWSERWNVQSWSSRQHWSLHIICRSRVHHLILVSTLYAGVNNLDAHLLFCVHAILD